MTLSIVASLGMFFIGTMLGFSIGCMCGITKMCDECENTNES